MVDMRDLQLMMKLSKKSEKRRELDTINVRNALQEVRTYIRSTRKGEYWEIFPKMILSDLIALETFKSPKSEKRRWDKTCAKILTVIGDWSPKWNR